MPSHSDDDMLASPEKPIKVVLETDPPARKPGRPRLGISSHFQDTGEMANHSHRFVWCIACIKSGRPMYKKDRLPARGDLMQRHLLSCKYVEEDVKQRFCVSPRSSSASSAGELRPKKARIANIISEPLPMNISPVHTNVHHHPILPPIASSISQEPAPMLISTTRSTRPPHSHPGHPPFNSPSGSSSGNSQLLRFNSPPLRSAASLDLPPISHRSHPYHSGSRGSHTPTSSIRPPLPIQTQAPQLPSLSLQHNTRSSPSSAGSGITGGMATFRISRNSPPTLQTSQSSPAASLSSTSTLRGRLQSGANAYGIVLSVPSPVTARIASTLGFDWACIDMEHSPQSASIMAEMVAAITSSSSSCTPLVRVPSHSEEWIKWAVDAGAQGIVIPGVQNKDQMWRLVSLCRSATQSLSTPSAAVSTFGHGQPRRVPSYQHAQPPLFGHGRHRDSPDAAAVSSPSTAVVSDIMVIPQIESTDAVANIDDILSVHGVDAVFVRPQNLSSGHSPMLPAQMTGGAVSGSLGHVIRAARHFTIPLGIDCADGDAARMRIQQGFQMVVVANDVDILASAATDQLNRARSA